MTFFQNIKKIYNVSLLNSNIIGVLKQMSNEGQELIDAILDFDEDDVIEQEFLNMKPENYISFEKGNHAFAGVETALVGKMLLWFWQRGY